MRVLLHETRTGEPLKELPFSEVQWSTGVCRADEITVKVPGYIEAVRGLRNLVVPRKTSVSVVREDGVCLAAGLVGIPASANADDGVPQLEIPARGVESLFEKRIVLPYPYGSLLNATGAPDPRYDTRIAGTDYGTMMRQLYLQAIGHPGGAVPIATEAPRAGVRDRTWSAIDGKSVQEAVEEISQLDGGVEWDWAPRVDGRDSLSWALLTGLESAPELSSPIVHDWVFGGADPAIRGLTEKTSPEFMCSTAFFTGGKNEDRILLSRRQNAGLIAAGFPLTEVWDSSHSTVSEQSALDGWAEAAISDGAAPVQFWSFDVRSDRALGLRHGDWCVIDVRDHFWIPDGVHQRRVVEVSGTQDEDWLRVAVSGMQGW